MNTQNTQIHITQWQRGFWLLAIANFLVAMSVYVLVPVMPLWLINGEGHSDDVGSVECHSADVSASFHFGGCLRVAAVAGKCRRCHNDKKGN